MGCHECKPNDPNRQLDEEVEIQYFILKNLNEINVGFQDNYNYIWIESECNSQQIKIFLNSLKIQYIQPILCKSFSQAKQIIKNLKTKIRIILSLKKQWELICKQFSSYDNITQIYPIGISKQQVQPLYKLSKKIKFHSINMYDFIIKIQKQNRKHQQFYRLPQYFEIIERNFINKSRYTLYGLLLFKNSFQAKNDFLRLVHHIYNRKNQSQIIQYQNDINKFNHLKILNQFIKESFVYKLINHFLYFSKDPSQLIYLRFPFQTTFNSIRYLYDQVNRSTKFKAYRKSSLDINQISYLQKNVGQHIQMYGFMFATLDQNNLNYMDGNVQITIIVQDQERQRSIDHGYVQIRKYNEFYNQNQVLFNALNIYKILSVTLVNQIYKVILKYGELARVLRLDKIKLTEKQRKIIQNYQEQEYIIKNKLKCQADVFRQCKMFDKEIQYRIHMYSSQKQIWQENLELTQIFHDLALAYRNNHEYKKSQQYYKKSLQIKFKLFKKEHIQITSDLVALGLLYKEQDDNINAIQYFEKALKIRLTLLGEDHNDTADIICYLGQMQKQFEDYNKSTKYYEKALNIYSKTLNENNKKIADTIYRIGINNLNCSLIPKAIKNLIKALKIYINLYGEYDINTANVLYHLGVIYENQEQYSKSIQFYQKVLKIYQNIFGQKNNDTANIFDRLGSVYSDLGKQKKAYEYYQKALKIRLEILQEKESKIQSIPHNKTNLINSIK